MALIHEPKHPDNGGVNTLRHLPSRADHVGSLLRPPALHTARAQHADGLLSASALRQIEDSCIRDVIRMQEEPLAKLR